MKKVNLILTGICALTCINNAFGMLMQKNVIHKITYKKIRQICTADFTAIDLNQDEYYKRFKDDKHKINKKKNPINQKLLRKNNALLRKIVEQNKENNESLKTVIKQNYLAAYRNYIDLENTPRHLFDGNQYDVARRKSKKVYTDLLTLEDLIPVAYDYQIPIIKYLQEAERFIHSLPKEDQRDNNNDLNKRE
ncbi:MAG TPA: hypothetical protein VKU36_01620 [Candidatus Babeliales bacterium]|nr:hypothetical protein [Candidatus Babeliales bacterium]